MRALLGCFAAAFIAGSADNATSLADRIGEAVSRLRTAGAAAQVTVVFSPLETGSPYTVITFPNREVAETELVDAGVDETIVRRIYSDLAFLGSMAGLLVVEQERQRLTFTTAWRRFPDVQAPENLIVSSRKCGPAAIELR